MLVTCVECGNATSDTAAQCPKCASPPELFLGPAAPCAECGQTFHSAYSHCLSCGAPSRIAHPLTTTDRARPTPEQIAIEVDARTADVVSTVTQASSEGAPKQPKKRSPFTLVPLWKWLEVWIVLWILARIGLILALSFNDQSTPQGENLSRLAGGFHSLTFFGAGLTYCNFVYSALRNYRTFNVPGIETSPWTGVAANFIPVFNLFAPYFVMTELWNVGAKFTGEHKKPPPAFAWWWLCWLGAIGGIFAGAILNSMLERQGIGFDEDLYQWARYTGIGTACLEIISGIALLGVIRGVTRYHEASRIMHERR